MADKYVGARMTLEERQKIAQLANQARISPSEVLRALVRAAVDVRPAQLAEATIDVEKFHEEISHVNRNLP